MFEVRVQARFEAAHHLTSYRGAPEAVHGHSWLVEATVAGEPGGEGMVYDFIELRGHLEALASRLHHRDINTVAPFDRRSPTSENLAAWFCGELQRRLEGATVSAITVWEGPQCSATYRPEPPVEEWP